MFQSNCKYYIKSTISSTQAAGTTFLLSTDFEQAANLETGTDTVSLVLKNGTQIERFEVTATGGTATIVKRGLTQAPTSTASVGLQKQWTEGTIAYVSALAFDLLDKQFTKPDRIQIPLVADTAARDALYTTLAGGELVEVTSLGAMQRYNAGTAQWESLAAGTPTPNASTTVSWKVEVATTAESKAGTDVWGTGAYVVATPSDIAANTQSGTFVYAVDSGANDTYVVALTPALTAYTTGQKLTLKFATANTGACMVNVNSLGAKSIKLLDGSDPLDWDIATASIQELIYDGTNFVIYTPAKRATTSEVLIWTNTIKSVSPKDLFDIYSSFSMVNGTSWLSPATSADFTITINLNKNFNTVFMWINTYSQWATSPTYWPAISVLWFFECGASGIKYTPIYNNVTTTSVADINTSFSAIAFWLNTMSTSSIEAVYDANYYSKIKQIYKDWTNLKIVISQYSQNHDDNKKYNITPVIVIN